MGVVRKVHAKLKGFEDIKEELEETGLAKEQLKEYYDLYEEYATNVKDANKLNKKEKDAEDEYLKEDKKVEKIEEKMEKMRQKAGPLARLKFSRAFFWSKEGRIYRILKRRLKRAKARRNLALHTLKELSAKAKGQERSLKQKRKSLNKSEKSIKKIWEQNREEMKLIRNLNNNQHKIEEVYNEDQQRNIQASVEKLKQEGDLPLGVEAKDLNQEIDEAVRSGKQPENSVVDEVEHGEVEVIDEKEAEKEIKLGQYEMASAEMPEAAWVKEEKTEKDSKDDKTKAIEQLIKDKTQIETELEKLRAKHIKSAEVAEYESDLAKIEEELSSLQSSDAKKEETVDRQEESSEENQFKKSLKEGLVFGPNTTIDRRVIEKMQKNKNNKIIQGMSPEEYMAYIGFVETKRRENPTEPVKYEEFLEEMKRGEGLETRTFYAKRALHSLEKMKTNKSEEEIDEMDQADQFIYGFAEDYHEIIEQEEKSAEQEQESMEIG